MRGISLLKRRYTPFGRPPNWVSAQKQSTGLFDSNAKHWFLPVLIFGRQKVFVVCGRRLWASPRDPTTEPQVRFDLHLKKGRSKTFNHAYKKPHSKFTYRRTFTWIPQNLMCAMVASSKSRAAIISSSPSFSASLWPLSSLCRS